MDDDSNHSLVTDAIADQIAARIVHKLTGAKSTDTGGVTAGMYLVAPF